MYTIDYWTKYGVFIFTPFIPDLTTAKVMYLRYVWLGCKSVRVVDAFGNTIWEMGFSSRMRKEC